ncbi:MAG: DUF4402 domain-containing protein [Novosphingobium sp.]
MPVLTGLATALLTASPAEAASGSAATAQGSVEATVIQPIVVSVISNLDFGMLTASRTSGGTVTIDPANSAQYGGGAGPACFGSGATCPAVHASRFAVRGEAARSYVVTAPSALVASGTLAGSGQGPGAAAPDLAIEALTVRTASRPQSGPAGTLDLNGNDYFSIGGTLVVPAGTSAAHYQATLPVIVTYS